MLSSKKLGGKKITLSELSEKDVLLASDFKNFINSFIDEDALIFMNKKVSQDVEKKWLKEQVEKVKNKRAVFLVARDGNTIVGTASVDRADIWRKSHVGEFGITIRKGYRGMGIGAFMMEKIIPLAEKRLKISVLRLGVYPPNKAAISLYKRFGFKKVAAIPRQIQYKEKLISEIIMIK